MAKSTKPSVESVAVDLTAREKVALFCAAADVDHAAVGIPLQAMRALEIRGLIERDQTIRYVVTDEGRAVLRAMLSDL